MYASRNWLSPISPHGSTNDVQIREFPRPIVDLQFFIFKILIDRFVFKNRNRKKLLICWQLAWLPTLASCCGVLPFWSPFGLLRLVTSLLSVGENIFLMFSFCLRPLRFFLHFFEHKQCTCFRYFFCITCLL